MLELYQKFLHQDTVKSTGIFAECELSLSGLINKKQAALKVSNPIDQLIDLLQKHIPCSQFLQEV